MPTPSIVALIPARSGSTRIKHKNIRPLAGIPLIAYTIAAARQSGVFGQIVVSTDSSEYAEVARRYGADGIVIRPERYATAYSPDYQWVKHALDTLKWEPLIENMVGQRWQAFSILRPTSPFRQAETIRRAWGRFGPQYTSLRAVERVSQHPGKMWVLHGDVLMLPYVQGCDERREQPWHDSQATILPSLWVQNASLEFAWVKTVEDTRTISGDVVCPFLTEGLEGYDINTEADFLFAEWLVQTGRARLPEVE